MIKKSAFYSLAVIVFLPSYATKRYDRLQPLSGTEAKYMTCKDIEIELGKVAEARRQIAEGGEVDFAAIAGFLGDFGIGNVVERNAAERTIATRETQLRDLKAKKNCPSVTALRWNA